jgi:predicted AAA+ superfamily ATPase
MIARILQKELKEKLFKGKTILLLGARQTGKITLIKSLNKEFEFFNADNPVGKCQLRIY